MSIINKIKIVCEEAYLESIWTKQLLGGLTKELKKGERGYAKIVLLYDAKTYLITSMTLVEANGNYTVYVMKDANTTANIDGNLFKVPAK